MSRTWRATFVEFARLEGRTVAVVADQPRILGGVLDVAASRKDAGFVSLCSNFGVPLVVLVDMPGVKQESAGVIRQGATLVRAFASTTVPRATVILRKAYGGVHLDELEEPGRGSSRRLAASGGRRGGWAGGRAHRASA